MNNYLSLLESGFFGAISQGAWDASWYLSMEECGGDQERIFLAESTDVS